jgi:hypothetical protein
VLDLAIRNADILQVATVKAVQGGPHLLALASRLKRIPATPDKARDSPVRHGRLSQYCHRTHGHLLGRCFPPKKDAKA